MNITKNKKLNKKKNLYFNILKILKYLILIIIIFILSSSFPLKTFSQENSNPFYGNPDNVTKNIHKSNKPEPLFRDSLFYKKIAELQKKIRNIIADSISNIENKKNLWAYFLILFLSFLYGLIHAMGPGHRKTVLFSYFLANDAKPFDGVIMGLLLSIIHAGVAIILILLVYYFLKSSYLESKIAFENLMEKISYISIVILGIILLFFKIFSLLNLKFNITYKIRSFILKIKPINKKNINSNKKSNNKKNNYKDNYNYSDRNNYKNIDKTKKISSLPFILLSSIVPCPGAMTILIFSIAAGQLSLGIFCVISMSLGMSVTISTLSVLTIVGKTKIIKLTEKKSKLKTFVFEGIEIIGIVIILAFGLIMTIPYF